MLNIAAAKPSPPVSTSLSSGHLERNGHDIDILLLTGENSWFAIGVPDINAHNWKTWNKEVALDYHKARGAWLDVEVGRLQTERATYDSRVKEDCKIMALLQDEIEEMENNSASVCTPSLEDYITNGRDFVESAQQYLRDDVPLYRSQQTCRKPSLNSSSTGRVEIAISLQAEVDLMDETVKLMASDANAVSQTPAQYSWPVPSPDYLMPSATH
ncbi:hypothetical protein FPHYL_7328 [Fusarium phyllophilum]|uniref:Uncharacterized protein n=1 Tax=Fusarium phyllophilum TaxID=47803 RepID=A0A8H5JPY0_9HYPO|nr:hypothetical protein FPHYL_7328 [Fusarium phyllophilum]